MACFKFGRVGAYRAYVLLLCLVAYLLNQLDRYLLPILSRPIAQELQYGDKSCLKNVSSQSAGNASCDNIKNSTQCDGSEGCQWTYNGQGYGYQIIVGPVFIVIYTFCGIFIGYAAQHFRRKSLLAFFLIFWSTATILSGFVKEYWQMALLRFALGIGEAGCTPFATSLLADMFDADSRATALAVYNFGIYVGYSMSYALGNFILQANIMGLGWRWAYYLSGMPGILFGILIFATVKEAPPPAAERKKNDETQPILTNSASRSVESRDAPSNRFQELKGIALMFLSPSLLMLCVAGSIRNSAGYVWGANTQPYFELGGQTPQQIGSFMSWIPLVGGSLGVLFGGFISDRLVKRRGLVARVAVLAVSQICAAPFALMALLLPSPWCYVSLIPSNIIGEMWVGVCLTVITELVDARMRTMAVAYYLFIISNVGGNMPLLVPVFQNLFMQTADMSLPLALRYSLVILFPGLYAISSVLFGLTICVMKWQAMRSSHGTGYAQLPTTKSASD